MAKCIKYVIIEKNYLNELVFVCREDEHNIGRQFDVMGLFERQSYVETAILLVSGVK